MADKVMRPGSAPARKDSIQHTNGKTNIVGPSKTQYIPSAKKK